MSTFVIAEKDLVQDITFVGVETQQLDASCKGELQQFFQSLTNEGHLYIAVDMSKVMRVSQEVLIVFYEIWRELKESYHGDVCFVGAQQVVAKDILSDEGACMHIFPDKASAINHFYWEYKGHYDTFLFTLPPDINVVPATRQTIRSAVEKHAYNSRVAFQMETMVDELCNNAIEHGVHGSEGHVEIAVAIGRNKIELNITNTLHLHNDGKGDVDNPLQIEKTMRGYSKNPSVDLDATRGRGLGIVKMLADTFEIDSSDDGTCVHVTKYREDETGYEDTY